MSDYPTIKLYDSDGVVLQYTFEYVLDLPDQNIDNPDNVKLTNLRSKGQIVIPGGDKAYEFRIFGILRSTDYSNLKIAMDLLSSSIANNTSYVLKVVNSISDTDSYNVIRTSPIEWRGPARKTNIQYYTVTFEVDS